MSSPGVRAAVPSAQFYASNVREQVLKAESDPAKQPRVIIG
jgi:hypothetical protein